MATPSGTIFRLKGSILSLSFLDYNATILPNTYDPWRDETKEQRSKTPTKGLSSGSRQSPTQLSLDAGSCDRQFAVLVSEKQSRVLSLPSQTCLYKQQLADASFVVKAELTSLKVAKSAESACLVCYVSTGRLHVYSLPSLRPLVDVDFVPLADLSFHQARKAGIVDPMLSIWGQQLFVNEDTNSIAKTFCLSSFGHGMYLSSPSEMQKFAISADFHQIMNSMFGDLYLECEMPEKPKEGFFTGLFGGGVRNLDREELFGETSGKASRSVAKHISGAACPPGMEHLQMRSNTIAGDIARTRMLMVERGEKLGQLSDKTEKMMNESENFSNAAHQLMLKYKDKKWYQL
jgi:syntaxin-binding protein 5